MISSSSYVFRALLQISFWFWVETNRESTGVGPPVVNFSGKFIVFTEVRDFPQVQKIEM